MFLSWFMLSMCYSELMWRRIWKWKKDSFPFDPLEKGPRSVFKFLFKSLEYCLRPLIIHQNVQINSFHTSILNSYELIDSEQHLSPDLNSSFLWFSMFQKKNRKSTKVIYILCGYFKMFYLTNKLHIKDIWENFS